MKAHILICLLFYSSLASAIQFSTQHSHASELATIDMLKALMVSHDLEKWRFTDKVHIDKTSIPHSHPILTLHTRHTSTTHKDLLLSTYLHEQIHWYLADNKSQTDTAIVDLKKLFVEVPLGFPAGGRDQYSSYLHLIVCYLELTALAELLSERRVTEVTKFWQQDHYTWIYRQVDSKRDVLAGVLQQHQLLIN